MYRRSFLLLLFLSAVLFSSCSSPFEKVSELVDEGRQKFHEEVKEKQAQEEKKVVEVIVSEGETSAESGLSRNMELPEQPTGEPLTMPDNGASVESQYTPPYQETAGYQPPSGYKPETPMYQTMYVVNCRESITLRTAPSTSASEIRQIPLGASVSFIENAANGFYKIAYHGDTGYSLASYLSLTPDSSYTPPAVQTSEALMRVVNCKEWISLRVSPSTSADTIVRIPLGETVTYLDTAANGFYRINYRGYVGYSLASYLQLIR